MNLPWFKQNGVLFTPSSKIGWGILAIAFFYIIYMFFNVDARSHSVSDTLMSFVFNVFIIAVVYSALAFFTSRPKKE